MGAMEGRRRAGGNCRQEIEESLGSEPAPVVTERIPIEQKKVTCRSHEAVNDIPRGHVLPNRPISIHLGI